MLFRHVRLSMQQLRLVVRRSERPPASRISVNLAQPTKYIPSRRCAIGSSTLFFSFFRASKQSRHYDVVAAEAVWATTRFRYIVDDAHLVSNQCAGCMGRASQLVGAFESRSYHISIQRVYSHKEPGIIFTVCISIHQHGGPNKQKIRTRR